MAASTSVEDELRAKRADHKSRMEKVKELEDDLKLRRHDLQERLVQFYKYIQDNELKRLRATKKANAEAAERQARYQRYVELNARKDDLERQKQESRELHQKYVKYENYLNSVLQEADGDEFLEPADVITRFQTLDENRNVLKKRKTQLERLLEDWRVQLTHQQQRGKNESVEMQNQVSDLQSSLEDLQKSYKRRQDELESIVTQKSSTTKTIGQVRMACENLFDRCQEMTQEHYGRRKTVANDDAEDSILQQLKVIGECLEDYAALVDSNKETNKRRARARDGPEGGR